MIEYDMKRNGSGYYDETPVKSGVFNGPQQGEIWESSQGKEMLVLKNHGKYCTTLFLMDRAFDDTMEIISREVRHVNPSMLGYIFNRDMVTYIKSIPHEKYMEVMEAVGERLGVAIKVSKAEENNLTTQAEQEAWKDTITALEDERDALKAELKDSEEMYHLACQTVKEEKAAREAAESAISNMHNAYTQAEEKAALYEKMYTALLDRIFARGEAK